ncbi:MAG: zinc ribbon domain-containing protein [Nitrospiria bacterium]
MSRALLIQILVGLVTAIVAQSKGRSFWGWWIYGALFPPFALLYALFLKRDDAAIQRQKQKKALIQCPNCREMIPPHAKRCKHCNKVFDIIDV